MPTISMFLGIIIRMYNNGADENEALAMGKEALGLHLFGMEQDGEEIPAASKLKDIHHDDNECVALIDVFMPAIRMSQENKSINRTVTLPAWLNARASECGINFSAVLQDALKTQLHLQ